VGVVGDAREQQGACRGQTGSTRELTCGACVARAGGGAGVCGRGQAYGAVVGRGYVANLCAPHGSIVGSGTLAASASGRCRAACRHCAAIEVCCILCGGGTAVRRSTGPRASSARVARRWGGSGHEAVVRVGNPACVVGGLCVGSQEREGGGRGGGRTLPGRARGVVGTVRVSTTGMCVCYSSRQNGGSRGPRKDRPVLLTVLHVCVRCV